MDNVSILIQGQLWLIWFPYLENKEVSLVTPSVYLIRKLSSSFKGEVFLLGGQYDVSLDTSKGALTIEMLKQFHFDHSFMSANGIQLENGDVYTCDFELAAVKKEILARSSQCDLLVDATKFHAKAISTWAHMEDFHSVYTESYPSEFEMYDNIVICQEEK